MDIKFSILVPVYKVEQYLPECVDSILAQTYTDFEVILIDDGSPDRCGEICDEYAARDNRVRVIHKPNGGLLSARKAGMAEAKGKYICFVDSDDFIANDMLETYHNILKDREIHIICAGYTKYCEGQTERILQQAKPGYYGKEALKKEIYPHMLSLKPCIPSLIFPSVSTKCFLRELLERLYKNVSNQIAIGEDVSVSYPALLSSEAVYVTDYCGYMYRQNPDSMTHTYNKELYNNMKLLLSHLYNIDEEFQWDARQQIRDYTITVLFYAKENELVYNRDGNYIVKKKKLKEYLHDPIFREAMDKVRLEDRKQRIVMFCLRHRIILPLYLWSRLKGLLAGE